MATTPVLDLDNLTPSATVSLRGSVVPMRTLLMMPPIERHRLTKMARRMDALELQDELSSDEEQELEALPRRLCEVMLKCDASFLDSLSPDERMEVIGAFLDPSRMMPPAETEMAPSRTGATSPPA